MHGDMKKKVKGEMRVRIESVDRETFSQDLYTYTNGYTQVL